MIKQRVTAQKRNRVFLSFKKTLPAEICGVNRNTVNRHYDLLRGMRREIGKYELY